MSESDRAGYVVARDSMDPRWPTHACPQGFWEELGRTIAKFGFLEDCLKRANLAITATRRYRSVEEATKAYKDWQLGLKKSLDESLSHLAKRLVKVVSDDDRFPDTDVSEIETKLRSVTAWRNALCHGAWIDYDCESGQGTLRHLPRKGRLDQSERLVSQADLAAIGETAVDITCRVINLVTSHGIQFPGSEGPGEQAWPTGPES